MAPVTVHVYDLGDFNGYIGWLGVGAFHSGVEVLGREYAFGAHAYECSGIFTTAPQEAPGEVVLKCSIPLGETLYSQEEIEELVGHMGQKYQGIKYHLLQTNCNHFSNDFAYALCGQRPPFWINRLANCLVSVHCLFPPTWLPPLKPPTASPTASQIAEAGSLAGQQEGGSGRRRAVIPTPRTPAMYSSVSSDSTDLQVPLKSSGGARTGRIVGSFTRNSSSDGDAFSGDALLGGEHPSDRGALL